MGSEDKIHLVETMFLISFILGCVLFLQFLLFGLQDLASQSPTIVNLTKDFLTPDVARRLQLLYYYLVSILIMYGLRSLRSNVDRIATFISEAASSQRYRIHLVVGICAWIHLWAALVMAASGGGQGFMFLVISLTAASVGAVSAFKLVANYEDGCSVARWVLAQSVVAAVVLTCKGCFLLAAVAIFPILPAIIALRTSADKLFLLELEEPSASSMSAKSNAFNEKLAKEECKVCSNVI